MKFLVIDGELLKNSSLKPTDKFILQFIHNLCKAGKAYWGEPGYLAGEFGVSVDYISKRFEYLETSGLIKLTGSGWIINLAWWEITGWGQK